jgi:hypothetical protein
MEEILKELARVRKEVSLEYEDFLSQSHGSEDELVMQKTKRKRLLFLFVKDLSSGVSGEVLANKVQRDSMSMSLKINRVSWILKGFAWLAVILMNMGMLIYVYLFAMSQTHSRQSAWFQSFVMWLLFEIFVSSTGLVIFVHLLIPLYVLTDISKLKEKVLMAAVTFRKRLGPQDALEAESNVNLLDSEFNSAKYFFTSWRVASLIQRQEEEGRRSRETYPESDLILQFRTQWPNKRFGSEQGEVSGEYDEAIILRALSQILLSILNSFLHLNVLLQEIIIQMAGTAGFGYLVLWMMDAWEIHPLLPLAPVILSLLLASGLWRLLERKNAMATSLDLPPIPDPPVNPRPEEGEREREGAQEMASSGSGEEKQSVEDPTMDGPLCASEGHVGMASSGDEESRQGDSGEEEDESDSSDEEGSSERLSDDSGDSDDSDDSSELSIRIVCRVGE